MSREILAASFGNHSAVLSNMVARELEISAHLVSMSLTQERPMLQVLFHAGSGEDGDANKIKSKTSPYGGGSGGSGVTRRWCLQTHVIKLDEELSAVCVLSSEDSVCIAELTLPIEWWDINKQMQTAEVYYSVYPVDRNLQCSSAAKPQANGKGDRVMSYIASVTLTHGQLTYRELKEDQHILVYIPQKGFYPGSKFRVPVKLQAESDLETFVIQ